MIKRDRGGGHLPMNCSVGDWGTFNDIMGHKKTISNLIASLTYLNCSLLWTWWSSRANQDLDVHTFVTKPYFHPCLKNGLAPLIFPAACWCLLRSFVRSDALPSFLKRVKATINYITILWFMSYEIIWKSF